MNSKPQRTLASVITAKGAAAISTIKLKGPDAKKILSKIFIPSNKTAKYETGKILNGCLVGQNSQTIDHIVVGCEESDGFALHCHGNPLIVEAAMNVLETLGAAPVKLDEYLTKSIALEKLSSTIDAEAKPAAIKAVTIQGVKIITNQTTGSGLAGVASRWLKDFDILKLQDISDQAVKILSNSRIASRIITGCKIVIAGPPNSGKSTLLNCLAGKQKAIVTDIAGTTRDWVSITCRIGLILAEFFDTAGLDDSLASTNGIDQISQNMTRRLIEQCDLIIYLTDAAAKLESPSWLANQNVVFVQNKCDLITDPDRANLPPEPVKISAKLSTGIDMLCDNILRSLQVVDFDPALPVCFTDRQKNLLTRLLDTKDSSSAKSVITELLNGPVCV